ncbi:inositol monophosphatase 1-like protein [Cricetulus griseus]|nr:inositol monophosphatase 1-like protein [Cricetulus griseus]
MPEYTNFNQTKPCNAKDVPSGNTQHSPDVKAGFLDVPGRPPGVQGRDFLSEQPPLPPEKPSLRPRQLSIAVRSREMSDPWQECMDYAVTLARQAGEMIREALKSEMNVMIKSSPADLVTVTDQKVEKMLLSSIKEKYPSHSFIGEESVAAGEKTVFTDKPTWIIDPVDGTTNFVHKFPFVAVSIGFVVKKQMEFGVVYSCVEDKMYTGRKGKGAFCNGQRLQVSQQEDITKSLLVTELGSSRKPETLRTVLSNMEKLCSIPIHGIRSVGTAAVNMCLVATGGADAYYEMGIHCWDMAGAGIIVTEAGGVLMDVTGGPFDLMSRRIIAANNKTLAERIAKEIEIIPLQRDDEKAFQFYEILLLYSIVLAILAFLFPYKVKNCPFKGEGDG